jgi:hypothetical protein
MKSSWSLMVGAAASVWLSCGPEFEPQTLGPEPSSLKTKSQKVLAECPYTAPAIDMEKELVVRDVSVVNDACRTQSPWNGTAPCVNPSSKGMWNFGFLMSQIGGNLDAAGTSDFVIRWLNTWMTDQYVNGHVVGSRKDPNPSDSVLLGIDSKIIKPWRTRSGCPASGACTLDFNQAPFRLLAIVNRVDLAGDAYGSSGNPGEMRFVFGFVDYSKINDVPSQNGALKATVILEYKLTQRWLTFDWAWWWHDLSTRTMPSESYNAALEQLTNWVTVYDPFWIPGGSAISQVRTNEIEFDPSSLANRVWELREQKRDCTLGPCSLRPDTVKQTPDSRYNAGGEQQPDPAYVGTQIDDYMLNNSPAIDLEDLSALPPSMIGGASRSKGALGQQLVWDLSSIAQANYEQNGGTFKTTTRHKFALQTCNGCHYAETGTFNFHIAPRATNARSQMSGFLAPADALMPNSSDVSLPLNYISFTDPVDGESRIYNDMWRRKCEMQRLLNFGPVQLFKPSGAH